jgi:hypothetical protein
MEISPLAKKWLPVLAKCRDIPNAACNDFAQILENQFKAAPDVMSFTRFVLPMVRSIWGHLSNAGVTIRPMPLENSSLRTDPIGPECMKGIGGRSIPHGFDINDYISEEMEGVPPDKITIESVEDRIAAACAKNIISLFNGEKVVYSPYLLIMPGTRDSRLQAKHAWVQA